MTSNQMSDVPEEIVDLVNEHFPKGKCKERGQANVLTAYFLMWHEKQLTAYKKELLSKANVYNVKSINGELVEPNTGVQAIPLSAIQEDEVENG